MSSHAIEKALWQVVTNPGDAQKFRADPEGFLAAFRLDKEERASLAALDVGALAARDVNCLLLLMAFNTLKGFENMPQYMRSMAQA